MNQPLHVQSHVSNRVIISRTLQIPLIILLLVFAGFSGNGQSMGISSISITPDPSSILELRTTSKGLLLPRMSTSQRDGISSPATGLVIFNTSTGLLNIFDGVLWNALSTGSSGVSLIAGTTNHISIGGTAILPTIDISSNYVGQTSITTLGTIGTGTWNGTLINPTYGGTGVNNGSKTITLGGNFITSGTSALTLTTTGATNVTLPTSGTLTTTADDLSVFASSTSAGLAGVLSDETGTGKAVFGTSPTLITPVLGAATATTINKVTIVTPSTGSTLDIANGKSLNVDNSITFAGTDGTAITFPSISSTTPLMKAGALTAATTVAVDFNAANVYTLTPGQNETLNASGGIAGGYYSIIITTSGTTSRTLTFGTNFKTTATLATGTTTAKVFVITFVSNGTTFYETSRTIAM